MRRMSFVCLFFAGIAGVVAAGCGGSSAVTGPDEPVGGSAVLQGAILAPGISGSSSATGVSALAAGGAWIVSIVGTSLSSEVDQDGRFVLAAVPSGSVTVRIEGPGVNAQVPVSGLVDGQVMSIEVKVSGGSAELTTTPACTPTAQTFFSGTLDQAAGHKLVVAGRTVDVSELRKVWRGERRIQLSELQVGEKVKVWGVLRGDAIVVAEEIAALTSGSGSGGESWVTFSGKVDSVGFVAEGVEANPGPYYPALYVGGRKVKTDGGTKFKWSDGTALDPSQIRAGDQAYVEGWSKAEGYVQAVKLVIDCR